MHQIKFNRQFQHFHIKLKIYMHLYMLLILNALWNEETDMLQGACFLLSFTRDVRY
jgi:hypothetical protein